MLLMCDCMSLLINAFSLLFGYGPPLLRIAFDSELEKNLGFLEFFLGFLRFFLGFLGFNVHNAEHRYMTHYN